MDDLVQLPQIEWQYKAQFSDHSRNDTIDKELILSPIKTARKVSSRQALSKDNIS